MSRLGMGVAVWRDVVKFRIPTGQRGSPRRPTIVVAEDDAGFRALLARILRADGYRVIEARDGMELIDYVAFSASDNELCHKADLVISDICMPRASGLAVAEVLKRRGLATRLIITTAFGSSDTHRIAKELGACAVLDKPFDPVPRPAAICMDPATARG